MSNEQKTTKRKYYIIEYYDEAVYGAKSGEKRQTTVAGPFRSYSEAFNVKQLQFRSYRATYYGIVEATKKPADTNSIYDFIDADREFNDDD